MDNEDRRFLQDRSQELSEIDSYLKKNEATIRNSPYVPPSCFSCKKKIRRSAPKFEFSRVRDDGKKVKRTYCEDCVEEIPSEIYATLTFRRSW